MESHLARRMVKKTYLSSMNFIILASSHESILNFRKELMLEIKKRGFNINIIAPNVSDSLALLTFIKENKMRYYDIEINRSSKSIVSEILYFFRLLYLFFKIKPVGVLSYTLKPNFHGMLISWIFRVPMRFTMITGLGYLFRSGLTSIFIKIAQQIYGFAIRRAHIIFFQNPDDKNTLLDMNVISKKSNSVLINGSGVNIQRFSPTPLPSKENITFLMIGRLLISKGVREFFHASLTINQKYPEARFLLLGGVNEDNNPDAISHEEVALMKESHCFHLLDAVQDVRPIIESSHVYVLPSYHEGLPRSVIEAMAMGRPVITSDAPGCRDTVIDGINGYIVPTRDILGLAAKMEFFINNYDQIKIMGKNSRQLACKKFDVNKVNKTIMSQMEFFL